MLVPLSRYRDTCQLCLYSDPAQRLTGKIDCPLIGPMSNAMSVIYLYLFVSLYHILLQKLLILVWDKLQVDHAERSKHEYNQIENQTQGVCCIVTTKPGHKLRPSIQLVSL